ncbi:nuclear transcription factor Y subunit C-6 [Cinnamomum micranthum f. kanehirae]|uniref:Nuclear transcription factor Y subunit C-6 n=1 Tax=Cinnamomum micranthum f. kanehirae TaxID=337451 RepID=A0A443NU05_9MAGN|nr:nuclear transcription factor Y subunit C-6 [Cinnamomum micranthum f. kanehirae]
MTSKADTHPGGSTRREVVPFLSQESFLGMPSQLAGETANPYLTSSELKRQRLQLFWRQQMTEVERIQDFKHHELPFARIKRIMKSNPEVKMVSADAPVLLSKASELFIMELTQISWLHAEEEQRRTVRRSDLGDAIRHKETFHFLEEMKEEEIDGNWLRTESLPNDGMEFPLMPANSIDQALGEDFMSRPQEIFQQSMIQQPPMSTLNPITLPELPQDFMSRSKEIFLQSMIQQPLMSTLTPTTVYEPTQEIFQQAMQATVYEPLQEIFQQPMQQPLMSTLTPAIVYEPAREIFQQSMIQQPLMSTMTPATAYELPQPYAGSMPPDQIGQGSDRT